MIKKITLGLTLLLSGFTVNTFAATAKSPIDVSVPCYNGGLTFGLAGLYLRPSSTGLEYSLTSQDVGNKNPIIQSTIDSINPHYDLGYRVNIGYVFPGTGNDVSLTHTYLNHRTKRAGVIKVDDEIAEMEVDAKARFKYLASDYDFGQHVDIGCRAHLRLLTGLRLAKIDSNYHALGKGKSNFVDPSVTSTGEINQSSRFLGIGPRFGSEFEYELGSGFGLVGQATGGLLVGKFKDTVTDHFLLGDVDHPILEETHINIYNGHTRVVPNLNAKLGLNYSYQFCNPTRTKLTIEAGYQVDHYFNSTGRTSNIESFRQRAVDTSFDGPYVGLQVHL